MSQHTPGAEPPLPNDVSQGWLPEDKRQTPQSPLPQPKFWGYQSLIPHKMLNALRHPGEIPWLVAAYAVTLAVYLGLLIFFIETIVSRDRYNELEWTSSSRYSTMSYAERVFNDYAEQAITLLILAPLVILIARALFYAQQRVRGIRISPTQFPEAYAMVAEAAYAAGLRRVPDAYVVSGNGVLNAFASGHGFRRFIAINSDLFEVGGQSRDPQALRFIIGHEVGHIAAGHVGYFRLLFTQTFMRIPVVGQALSRAQEYTADNFGYRYCPEGGPGAIKVLTAGKYLNQQVNFDEFADRAVNDQGFAIWLINLISTHPVLTWRAHALRNRHEPGRLFWRPRFNPPSAPPSLIPSQEPPAQWPDPIQATGFMDEQKPAWEDYNLNTVKTYPAPQDAPKIQGTLFAGWEDAQARAARAAYAARWEQYAASQGVPGYAPGYGYPMQPAPGQPGYGQPMPNQQAPWQSGSGQFDADQPAPDQANQGQPQPPQPEQQGHTEPPEDATKPGVALNQPIKPADDQQPEQKRSEQQDQQGNDTSD
ncbi:peptidase M48 [Rothia sp. HMSC069C01]|uniref:M48 family metallopeptidase n=1 Tax=Rothia sp. HMSC069C01 TaxID=1739485 RepID=UPI0008A4E2DE|nr:M48 family metallopeptidase [Rothia sp. HMSC069C01]OFP53091.1 peptidase M48 [Rothia sp. HMSC069C01]